MHSHASRRRTAPEARRATGAVAAREPVVPRVRVEPRDFAAASRRLDDFSRVPVLASKRGAVAVRPADDVHEREADRVAAAVMRSPARPSASPDLEARRTSAVPHDAHAPKSPGRPLDPSTRRFMETRFGADFAHVRTHTDAGARSACRTLGAQAFTHGRHVFFAAGRSPAADALTAHELVHVVQQTRVPQHGPVAAEVTVARHTSVGALQRKLEVRPPGRGEASAFGRAQELVDRLNTISTAVRYTLTGQVLSYTVVDATALTHFDRQMTGFIDRADLVPMRLITHQAYVGGGPLFGDSFQEAYVDLDDMLADDVYSFQSDLLHFLTERFHVAGYARLIGTNIDAQFPASHRAGKDAEAAQLQSLFGDPTVAFVYEERKPDQTWVNAFKSKAHGYWVFQVVHHANREVAGGEMWVKRKDGTRASIDDFRKERGVGGP